MHISYYLGEHMNKILSLFTHMSFQYCMTGKQYSPYIYCIMMKIRLLLPSC